MFTKYVVKERVLNYTCILQTRFISDIDSVYKYRVSQTDIARTSQIELLTHPL